MPDGGGRTVGAALRAAAARLAATSDTARLDAELLMAHALGTDRSALLLGDPHAPAPAGFAALVARRAAREPVAYILGHQPFYGLTFAVTPSVLIPRSDSEAVVGAALREAPDAREIADLGTGSGALLLACLHHLPGARGTGFDASPAAIAVAAANAAALGLADRAAMRVADWTAPGWAEGAGPFDLVLCNPPYVEADAVLDADVRDHEPAAALFAGADGLDAYRAVVPQFPALLAPGGCAAVEIGHTQGPAVRALAAAAGLSAVLVRDLAARPRALVMRRASHRP